MTKWINQLTVAGRLSAGFGFLLLLLLALGSVSALELIGMSKRMDHIVDVNNHRTDLARDLLENINGMAIQARTITLLTDMGGIDGEMRGLNTTAKTYANKETSLQNSLSSEKVGSPERLLFDEIVALGKKAMPQILAAAQQGADGDNVGATMTLTTQARPTETLWRKKVSQFVELQTEHTAAAVAEAKIARNRALTLALAVVLLAVASGTLVAWRIVVSIKSPIEMALSVAERIAEGDLTSDVSLGRQDELGRLLQAVSRMQDRLRFLVGEIRDTSESIFVASSEVASGNADLSVRTERAASNLENTASSMDTLTGTVRQSAESASQANKLAASARSVATRGGEVVSQVVSTMNEINNSSRKIADIIGVIDGIAFQTNVLALNAAVEAARAGEQGRGFAVVAGEVRSLAGRSAEAAREIKTLIGGSVERVEAGARLVSTAGSTMNEIVASVERVSDIISEITAAATEQSSGIGEVNTAVVQLDQMTQQNAALVEESAAAAESLKEQASRLSEMVGTFKLLRA